MIGFKCKDARWAGRGLLPVHGLVISFGSDNFRRQIIRSAAKSPGDIRNLLGKSKIRNLEMSVPIEQEVLGLEITVNDVEGMEVVQRQGDFGSVELGNRVREALH